LHRKEYYPVNILDEPNTMSDSHERDGKQSVEPEADALPAAQELPKFRSFVRKKNNVEIPLVSFSLQTP
jgi:hypothetical protein